MDPIKLSKQKILLGVGDTLIIILSINGAYLIRMKQSAIKCLGLYHTFWVTLVFVLVFFISFFLFRLYDTEENFRSLRFLSLILGSLVLSAILSAVVFYVFPFLMGRGVYAITMVLVGTLAALWRVLFFSFFKAVVPQRNVLLVGEGRPAAVIESLVTNNPEYKVIGRVKDLDSLENIIQEHPVDDIVIIADLSPHKALNHTLDSCQKKGVNIYDMPAFYEHLTKKVPVFFINDKWFLYHKSFGKLGSRAYHRVKRVVDIAASFVLSVLLIPLGLLIAFGIKVSSKGPVFYKQARLGKDFKKFNLLKFRTMVKDAEKENPRWTEKEDPRITVVGRVLRRFRLDEIPQFVNILRGDMSLIGPRPEREHFTTELIEKIPHYSFRLSVKPGLTGWAQANYQYGSSVEESVEKLRYDLFYIKNMSLFLDFWIVLKTIQTIFFGKGR